MADLMLMNTLLYQLFSVINYILVGEERVIATEQSTLPIYIILYYIICYAR